MIKRIGLGILLLIVLFVAVLGINTLRYSPGPVPVARDDLPEMDRDQMARDLAQALTFRTIAPAERNRSEFVKFIDWMADTYPATHQAMELTRINDLTLLYRWPGTDSAAKPVLLTAHYDVVSATEEGEGVWDHPPFDGVIADGFVWGRGTLDDKGSIIALMQAAENLAKAGFQPSRDIYFSFGHDEETLGEAGAAKVAEHFQAQNIRMDWSLDEGSMIFRNMIGGIDRDIASVNLAEKGYLTLDIIARAEGGHSSLPPRETAVGILAEAISKLQAKPYPGGLDGLSADFFEGLGPHFSLPEKLIFANTWALRGVLEAQLSGANTTNALLRTTIAPTMLRGSDTENVLPHSAVATVNFRLHPRDTVEEVIDYVTRTLDDDRVELSIKGDPNPASAVASTDHPAYAMLRDSFEAVFDGVIVVPGLTVAGTDTKHYGKISDNAYRIAPFVFEPEDVARLHGRNERISLENLEKGAQFYQVLLGGL